MRHSSVYTYDPVPNALHPLHFKGESIVALSILHSMPFSHHRCTCAQGIHTEGVVANAASIRAEKTHRDFPEPVSGV